MDVPPRMVADCRCGLQFCGLHGAGNRNFVVSRVFDTTLAPMALLLCDNLACIFVECVRVEINTILQQVHPYCHPIDRPPASEELTVA